MSSRFIDFLHETDASSLPDEVLDLGRRWLLDLIGVAAGGAGTRMSRIIRDHAAGHFGPGARQARILFDGRAASPAGVALAGGITIDALDGHDGHKLTKGHVGCGVFPSLLAVSEAEGRLDDRAFLAGLVTGYEIGTRAGIALHRTVPDYHTSGAWVAVAAAALGARVLGLDAAQSREAIGIAEYHGPRSQMMRCIDHPTMVKDGSGWGAMAGVSAAYLAADGFTGAPAITVEGADVADLWDDLGTRWRIAEQYYKAYPVCRWAQPPLQAVLNLRSEHKLTSGDVERIEITTFHQSRRLATRDPKTTEEAQYSTAYPTAVALVRGRVDPVDVAEASFADPEIRRLAQSMTVTESDEYNAAFPARRIAHVALVLKDGRRLQSEPTEALYDPEAPVDMATVRAKFRAYAGPALGTDRAAAIEAAVDRLGDGSGIADLIELVQAPAAEPGDVAA
ncbi:MmgE/PrpD family protein [Defluviimonas sp. D31]|uniref:MmgE/PrpD family protein n=1 Tax=Defluviimonas sp. D31 TaxID=3083253 RepID=UPI00296F24C3|nr:MmgE/PrpD family protein [Defluviimonas sp. D31]MDW4550053.1 MmgE/PrpD family protein [Defluviimonas sp. D31]